MTTPATLSSVPAQTPYIQYVATSGQTVFPYPFEITQDSDLIVVANGVTLATDSGYTVSGVGASTGGNATFTSGRTAGDIITLYRGIPISRVSQIAQNSGFSSTVFNAEYNNIYLLLQQLQQNIDQCLQIPNTNNPSPTVSLTPGAYANKYLAFDANGNPTPALLTSSGSLTASVLGGLLYPQTAAESSGGITPANIVSPVSLSSRYGMDPAGSDSTGAFAELIDSVWAMYYHLDAQGLWDGGGGAQPIATVAPGKYKLTGSTILPSGMTLTGQAHPANTVSHTRLIMDSTGTTPALAWSANTQMVAGQLVVPASANGYYYKANIPSTGFYAGTTGGSAPVWPTVVNNTVADNTVTWTCVAATGSNDNRNKPMFTLSRVTHPGGSTLQNQRWDGTIENLEFWAVTEGNNFSNPLGGAGIPFGSYPNGGILYIDCDTADARIVSCCFQNSACGIRIHNAKSGQTAGDGVMNTSGVVLYVEETEFDAAGAHIYADNSNLTLHFKNCAFYGGIHKYAGCTGTVVYENCRFFGGAFIDASDPGNAFTVFRVNGGEVDNYNGADTISVYGATLLDVKNVTMAQNATGYSSIVANYCSSGSINGNSINDSGFNTSLTTGGSAAAAAIKLIDCQNMSVQGNNITATDAATYGGFGILTVSSARTSQYNFVSGNAVTAPYNGATYNGQGRAVNLAGNDVLGVNYSYHDSTSASIVGSLKISGNESLTGNVTVPGGAAPLVTTSSAVTSGGASASPTLGNAGPAGATTPTKWVPISDNGTTRYFPVW